MWEIKRLHNLPKVKRFSKLQNEDLNLFDSRNYLRFFVYPRYPPYINYHCKYKSKFLKL